MLFTSWEVRTGRNCARGLEYRLRPYAKAVLRLRAQFFALWTDLGRWIKFLFFSYWDLKVSGKFSFHLQPMCVEVGCICVDEARDWLQTKTKHYNMNFGLEIYIMALTTLFKNKERFLCLARQFIIWESNKDKRIDELDIQTPWKKIKQAFSLAK